MASDNDITVRKRRCKDVFDGDLAHYIPGSSDDALTYSKKAEWWAVKWPDAVGDGKVDNLDYSSKKWAVYTDGPVDTANNLFSSKQYALNAEEQAGISLTWANKSQEWAESDTVIEGTETSHSSKYWSGISKLWSDDALSYSLSASNAQQMAWKWAEKTDGPVTGELYSAKYWAGKAEERSGGSEQWSIISHNWANGGLAEGATQPSSTDTNSSLYWAYQSALSAAAADQYQQLAYSYQEESKRLKLNAVIARTGAETALVKAETALRLALTALTAAEAALTAAETAQGKAEDALEAAETALAAAETALTAAETAQTKSEQALDAAETALTAAETAQGKAESAQNAAETALNAAEVAQGKAEDAQTAAETAQGKSEEALAAAETALTAAETALGITEAARDRALEWAESDQAITVPGDADTHYSAKKYAQDALDTFGLTANVYTLTVGVYNDTTIASAAAHGHADDAMRANESALEAKGDAIDAQTAAETAQVAAEAARDLAQEWADNDEDVPVGDTDDKYSAKHWSTKAENAVASLGNVAMRDAANVFQKDNQFNGNVSIGQPGTPGNKAKCQLTRTSAGYNASGALMDNLGRYMLITYNGASNKTNFISYINNHSSAMDITASAADGNDIYLEAKVAGTYSNDIKYYAVGSFCDNLQASIMQGSKTAGTDEVRAQCQKDMQWAVSRGVINLPGSIIYTKGGVVNGVAIPPPSAGSRTIQSLVELINQNEDIDFTASVSGNNIVFTNKAFGADTTTYYLTGVFAVSQYGGIPTTSIVRQGTVTPGTEDIPGSSNTLTLNGESVPTHFGNNEYVGINIFTGPVGIQSTGSFTNNGMTVLNGGVALNGETVLNGHTTKTASTEVWSSDTVMTLGMHQVGAWWDQLEADMLFDPAKTELSGNALMILEGTTNEVQALGVENQYPPAGQGLRAATGLSASNLVAGRIALNPRAQVKLHVAGTTEDSGGMTAFDSTAHEWLWVTWYKAGNRRDINLIGAYAAANSCPVVLVCDTHLSGTGWQVRPITTKIVDAYLCSAPARNTAEGRADTICLVLVGAKKGITDLYIGFKGGNTNEKRLMHHYTLPQFGFGEIGAISNTNWLPSITAARGNLATSGAVTHKMDMWAYNGVYQPTDPAGSAAFFVKDAQAGIGEGGGNTKYDVVQTQTMKVYLADVQTEQPSTAPATDYTFSASPHDNKDDVLVPASGGYVLAKIVWSNLGGKYQSQHALAQAVVMDSWLVDTEAGAEADGMVMGMSGHGYGTWKLSKAVTDTFDTSYTVTCYAYIKAPANTTGLERDGYAVVGISGMRASLIHIVQAAN